MMEMLTKPTTTPRSKVQYNLRIDPELMEWLKETGKEYERPVNYLINHAVKQMKEKIESAKA
ncbi:DNA-binding protein [Acinetobacter radioresistens]|nr:DNA-binding protein [Acinetobacter radioresistens]